MTPKRKVPVKHNKRVNKVWIDKKTETPMETLESLRRIMKIIMTPFEQSTNKAIGEMKRDIDKICVEIFYTFIGFLIIDIVLAVLIFTR